MKIVPLDPPESRVPAVQARAQALGRELAGLNLQAAERALACAEGKPGARESLAELQQKIAVAEFELAGNGLARDLAARLDTEAFHAWRADVQTLPPDEIVAGISRDQCCHRCGHGECIIGGADSMPSTCLHPVLVGPLNSLRHQGNEKVVAVFAAARAKTGTRR